MKPDGTGEADFRSIIFSNGEPIFIWGKAMGKLVDPTPIEKIEENLTRILRYGNIFDCPK